MFGRATIRLGIGPHSSLFISCSPRPLASFLKFCAVGRLFLVKVACSASCRVEKCDDFEMNLKMPLNVIYIFRIGISLKWLYILMPIVVIPHLHDTTGCQTGYTTGMTTGCIV